MVAIPAKMPASPAASPLPELLQRTARGDRAAFRRVYELTSAHLLGVALRILGRQQAAEDVLQDAFVSVWKNAASYDPTVAQPMTWLITIVRNRTLDVLRAEGRRNETALDTDDDSAPADVADSAPGPLQLLSKATESMRIKGCMDSLDASLRQSLALAYYQGLSHAEVAEQMACPLGSVKTWIRKGLAQLKNCLGPAV
jgi:RNA polymerase sigma-70 factor, ECF subfamily